MGQCQHCFVVLCFVNVLDGELGSSGAGLWPAFMVLSHLTCAFAVCLVWFVWAGVKAVKNSGGG